MWIWLQISSSNSIKKKKKKKKEWMKNRKKDGRGERALWWIKSYRLSNSIGNTPTERLQHLYTRNYTNNTPHRHPTTVAPWVGWNWKGKKRFQRGERKKMNEIQFSTLGRIQKWPQIGNWVNPLSTAGVLKPPPVYSFPIAWPFPIHQLLLRFRFEKRARPPVFFLSYYYIENRNMASIDPNKFSKSQSV